MWLTRFGGFPLACTFEEPLPPPPPRFVQNSSEKAIANLGDSWWTQMAKQEGDEISKSLYVKNRDERPYVGGVYWAVYYAIFFLVEKWALLPLLFVTSLFNFLILYECSFLSTAVIKTRISFFFV